MTSENAELLTYGIRTDLQRFTIEPRYCGHWIGRSPYYKSNGYSHYTGSDWYREQDGHNRKQWVLVPVSDKCEH